MKTSYLFCLCLFLSFLSARAQFSGSYRPAKFTTTLSAGSNGSVNTAATPASITISGSDNSSNPILANTDYTVTAVASGVWSFNWTYQTPDDPQFDPAGILVNGVFTQLSDNVNASQSNTYTGTVTAGNTIGFRVNSVDNSFGKATLTITSFSPPGGVLPVTLSTFTVKQQGTANLLQWTAATEINTSFYEVQRSANGLGFNPLGRVNAALLSGRYSFTDSLPLPGATYYRLRMVDNDGRFSYSPVILLKKELASGLKLYPNPATGVVVLTLQSASAEKETVQLYNVAGALLQTQIFALVPGINKKELNIASVPPGTYIIKIASGAKGQSFVKK
jgi:hypothetical protein